MPTLTRARGWCYGWGMFPGGGNMASQFGDNILTQASQDKQKSTQTLPRYFIMPYHIPFSLITRYTFKHEYQFLDTLLTFKYKRREEEPTFSMKWNSVSEFLRKKYVVLFILVALKGFIHPICRMTGISIAKQNYIYIILTSQNLELYLLYTFI